MARQEFRGVSCNTPCKPVKTMHVLLVVAVCVIIRDRHYIEKILNLNYAPSSKKMFLSVKKCRYVLNVIHIYTPVIVSDVFPGQC